jgi:cation-transporting P-type ATPase E
MYTGLTTRQVNERIQNHQQNERSKKITKSNVEIIRSNIFTYFNFVNVVLFAFVLMTGKLKNGLFLGTVIFNAFVGIYQQVKSKRLLDKLSILAETKVKVRRDNEWKEIFPEEIVVDDDILLPIGVQILVDGAVLEGKAEVDESALTGESKQIEKNVGDEVYAGTFITSGNIEVKVTRVGKDCSVHKIIEDASKESRAESILHQDLEKIIKKISFVIVPAGIFLYCTQYFFVHMTWDNTLLKTIAALVGMIPEGLVVLTSIALAVSSIRLSKDSVLVQDLFSIESLARVDTACFDKTGTLTTGNMVVDHIECFDIQEEVLKEVLGSYLNDEENPNPTSAALMNYFQVNNKYSIKDTLAFSSKRKYAAKYLEGYGSIYVGAYSYLFLEQDEKITSKIEKYAKEGKRVIIVGKSNDSIHKDELPNDLKLVSIIVIQEEMRSNAKEIIEYFQKENGKVYIISGDDPVTVSSLAKVAGVKDAERYVDLSKNTLSMDEVVKKYVIFGRVKPEEKKQLVLALKKEGHHILMTGDGVNDVPALKVADVSVSIGEANDAAKNNASIILLDNDFSRIPAIVDEGRRVINNISRASSMYLVKTTFSILLAIYVIICREAYPFLPIHLTLISAIGVGIPTFILQMEPSFERIQGNFLKNAFLKSLPSSISVFLTAMLCICLKKNLGYDEMTFYGLFVFLTAYIYLITLSRVYRPMTRYRFLVIFSMCMLLVLSLLFAKNMISVSYHWVDAWVFMLGIIIEPILIFLLRSGIEKLADQ